MHIFLEKINKKGYNIIIMIKNDTLTAQGSEYFTLPECPIAVVRVNSVMQAQHRRDYTLVPHRHDFSELVIITRGSGVQIIDELEFPVVSGDVFMLQGNSVHGFLRQQDIGMINIMFNPKKLPLPMAFLRKMPGFQVIFHLEPNLRKKRNSKDHLHMPPSALAEAERMISRMETELNKTSCGCEAMATALLVELLCFVSRYYQNMGERNPAALLRLGEVISRLEREYASQWTLTKIARLASMSPNHLLRIFRAATGFTPLEYLVRLRLRHAARYLVETRKSISEIAADTGFSDSNYFSKRFRNFYGTSPREYRRDPGSANKTAPTAIKKS